MAIICKKLLAFNSSWSKKHNILSRPIWTIQIIIQGIGLSLEWIQAYTSSSFISRILKFLTSHMQWKFFATCKWRLVNSFVNDYLYILRNKHIKSRVFWYLHDIIIMFWKSRPYFDTIVCFWQSTPFAFLSVEKWAGVYPNEK